MAVHLHAGQCCAVGSPALWLDRNPSATTWDGQQLVIADSALAGEGDLDTGPER